MDGHVTGYYFLIDSSIRHDEANLTETSDVLQECSIGPRSVFELLVPISFFWDAVYLTQWTLLSCGSPQKLHQDTSNVCSTLGKKARYLKYLWWRR